MDVFVGNKKLFSTLDCVFVLALEDFLEHLYANNVGHLHGLLPNERWIMDRAVQQCFAPNQRKTHLPISAGSNHSSTFYLMLINDFFFLNLAYLTNKLD
jgi:hypothetical protein